MNITEMVFIEEKKTLKESKMRNILHGIIYIVT